jgi:hypothetical protein
VYFAATVTRGSLGLSNLNIHDGLNYIVTNKILGAQVAWDKNQVSSPWVDGDVTISRRRPNVSEPFSIHVHGDDHADMKNNVQVLLEAFMQNQYNLAVTVGNQLFQYKCETADYQMEFDQSKMFATMTTINFQIPRRPVAVSGV